MRWENSGPYECTLALRNFTIVIRQHTTSDFYVHMESTTGNMNYVKRLFMKGPDLTDVQEKALDLLRTELEAIRTAVGQDLMALEYDRKGAKA